MASVDEGDVRHVASLARLALSDERVREMARDLGAILGHMEVLRRVDTTGVPEFGVDEAAGMPLRPDVAAQAGLTQPPLQLAPLARDGLFLVPRLATHDEGVEGRES